MSTQHEKTPEQPQLKSSVTQKGKVVTQYILFASGNEKTIEGVITDSISQSYFTRFDTVDGKRVYVNTKNVDMFEVHEYRKEVPRQEGDKQATTQ